MRGHSDHSIRSKMYAGTRNSLFACEVLILSFRVGDAREAAVLRQRRGGQEQEGRSPLEDKIRAGEASEVSITRHVMSRDCSRKKTPKCLHTYIRTYVSVVCMLIHCCRPLVSVVHWFLVTPIPPTVSYVRLPVRTRCPGLLSL